MAYCPKCGVEYRESAAECMDCHAPLRPGDPPPDDARVESGTPAAKLVRIRVFGGPASLMQADLARNLLETEGIPCVLQGHVMGEILPGVEPIQMLVHESDAGRANDILTAYLDNPQAEPAE
ncbi:MAG: putative signal transducing protein [Terriglobia bacterium]